MSTLVFFLACFLILVIVLSKIPGFHHIVKMMFDLLQTIVATSWLWAWGLAKKIHAAHFDFLKHLFLPAEKIDPTEAIDKDA